MRVPVLVCCLAALPASGALAAQSPSPFSAGLKLCVGGSALPGMGLGFGPNVVDFAAGAVVERAIGRRDAVIAAIEYQDMSNVMYFDETESRYTVSLASAFAGYKSRLTGGASGPYYGATFGITRWSGRPGDTGVSPTLGAFFGVEATVRDRSRVFVEAGTRYGLQDRPGSVPRWNLGFGFSRGF
jgi:hypothetical protein